MVDFSPEERGVLAGCFGRLTTAINTLTGAYSAAFLGKPKPKELVEILIKIGEADQLIPAPKPIPPEHLPILKRAILTFRRSRVAEIESMKQRTNNGSLQQEFTKEQEFIDSFLKQQWFRETQATPIPHIGRYINLRGLAELSAYQDPLPERKYDDKFGILSPASQFPDDVKYWRSRCELRGTKLAVAYLDIDFFKQRLNDICGNTKIDTNVLPLFMEIVERKVYGHGSAYREGGDEYLIVLPNVSDVLAVQLIDELRESLEQTNYPEVDVLTTVSVGLCCADADCFLTDSEFRVRADWAKELAKETGRNRIAGYRGTEFRKEDRHVVKEGRQYPAPVPGTPASRSSVMA